MKSLEKWLSNPFNFVSVLLIAAVVGLIVAGFSLNQECRP